jgi:hypothetical protein
MVVAYKDGKGRVGAHAIIFILIFLRTALQIMHTLNLRI